jgi:hypothetical protein
MMFDLSGLLPPVAAIYLMLFAFLPFSAFAAAAEGSAASKSAMLQASAAASLEWLNLVDAGKYAESWDAASPLMKLAMPKNSWEKVMQQTRKPLGAVKKREVLDQRTAQNPHGMPAGDYIVMFYKTAFSQKPEAFELVTLYLQNGKWHVVTYQVEQGSLTGKK